MSWLSDLTVAHPAEIEIPATPTSQPGAAPWLLVSKDCSHGATVTVSPAGTTTFLDVVRTADGQYAAVRLDAHHSGVVTVTVTSAGRVVSTTVVRTT